jgi:membrane dipeptidase
VVFHATEAAQRQIIEASKAPVVASHIGLRALCSNPTNMPDEILRALAAKDGLVGIHANASVISQRYYDWSLTHPPANAVPDTVRAELSLIRSPNRDYGEYIEALDIFNGTLWR